MKSHSGFPSLGTRSLSLIHIAVISLLTSSCATQIVSRLTNQQDCDLCPEIVRIAGGVFEMGRDGGEPNRYDGPVRRITIEKDFWMSRNEITVAQYKFFMNETGYEPVSGCNVYKDGKWGWDEMANWKNPGLPSPPEANDPIVCISWFDAIAYTDWLTQKTGEQYRLPTEAEWEYVARDGTAGEFAWNDGEGCIYANMFDLSGYKRDPEVPWPHAECDDGLSEVAAVGSLAPNSFGVYDILGNVWEWTQDCYVLPYPDQPVDGSSVEVDEECERRTVRGGSWETRPDRLVSAFRGRDKPDKGFRTFGIRVVRELSQN